MILVTGGTGLVGAHLLYKLAQKHDSIRATKRASSDTNPVLEVFKGYSSEGEVLFAKIEWVTANITEIPALTKAFKEITSVYHCAAYVSFDPKNYKKLKKANIEGTANVVNLCLEYDITKLCYVSSIATLGTAISNGVITENTFWNPEEKNSVYAITKYGAEMEVWRGSQEGLEVVIVNPGVILGEGFWHSSSGVIIKNGNQKRSYTTTGSTGFVDVQDVVSVMIQLMGSPIKNERFILVAENLTYQQLMTQLAIAFGHAPPKKMIPKWILVLVSYMDKISSVLFKTKRQLPLANVHSLYTGSEYGANKIQEALGFSFIPMETTLNRVTQAYKNYCSSTGSKS